MGTRGLCLIDTLVLQSHRQPLPARWLERCVESVRTWSGSQGFSYEFIGDELFAGLPQAVVANTQDRLTARSDLARLLRIKERLSESFRRVVWLDADVLVFRPETLELPDASFAVGRECWLSARAGKPRIGRAVHNASLLFSAGDPFLDFYLWSAERLLASHDGPMVPQLVGPKLLTLLHNAIDLPVWESVGMASPDVVAALASGDDELLRCLDEAHGGKLAALNLCGSLAQDPAMMEAAIEALLDD